MYSYLYNMEYRIVYLTPSPSGWTLVCSRKDGSVDQVYNLVELTMYPDRRGSAIDFQGCAKSIGGEGMYVEGKTVPSTTLVSLSLRYLARL